MAYLLWATSPTSMLLDSIQSALNAYPWGTYSLQDNSTNYAYNRLASDVLLIVGGKQTAMKQGSIIPSFDITIPIDVGQPNLYPFDKYKTYFDIASYRNSFFKYVYSKSLNALLLVMHARSPHQPSTDQVDFLKWRLVDKCMFYQSLPLLVDFESYLLSDLSEMERFYFRDRCTEIANAGGTSGIIIVDTFIERSGPQSSFPWRTCDWKLVDVAGFMWNMVLVAVSCLLLIINYITKYKRDKVRSDLSINGSSNTTLASEPHSTVVKVTGMQPTYSPQEHGFSPHRNGQSQAMSNTQNTLYDSRS
ncbi:hypothetical protein BSLG_005900 [Batrachochytrium salamandrivorans]|nr:hypothetical protein BSLG_005900 [Batrachochytrium salamandrivorans]